MSPMTLEEFIQNTIIDELKIMVDTPRLKYLSFIVMSSAIEFLGACIDNKNTDFHPPVCVPGLSPSRFKKAIDGIPAFEKYRGFVGRGSTIDLYGELRCGMSHAALPQPSLELTERKDKVCGKMHLQIVSLENRRNRRLILVCEDLCEDIRQAAGEVIQRLRLGKDHHKAMEPFLLTDIKIAGIP